MRFFLDRMNYYVNVSCLEGRRNLLDPSFVRSFDDLVDSLPNLSGIIYNSCVKQKYKNLSIFKEFSQQLRNSYRESYRDRKIEVAVKCGISRTEEIGVHEGSIVSFFDFDISKSANGSYKVTKFGPPLSLNINGISDKNGFTIRKF